MATVSLRDSQDDIPAAGAGTGLGDVLSAGVRAVGDPLPAEVPVRTVLVQVVLDVRVLVVVVDVVVQAIVAAGGAIRLLSGPTCCQCCCCRTLCFKLNSACSYVHSFSSINSFKAVEI